ncbi:hypothetical protein I8752_10080 [Nostocaceae cyanobacterium CENA369]|uniref:Uncharacterized protein n=1 Tax=Dendronalium phyllosphericum CENA369 TaxID=1725256 RepID=A0A8J7LGW1_9NOST|nr:hypothetical protein [Dendronalium phyllosphericum]MBH8573354.1 hypothetical protein [Dendronalium phyllosphericum CENA369]
MVFPELEQQLLELSPNDKLYIIQLLAQSLTTNNNNTHPDRPNKISEFFCQSPVAELPEEFDLTRLLKTLIESLQPVTPTEITEYPLPQFYGCIQDETFFRHPQGQQPEREPIL